METAEGPMVPRRCRVVASRRETADTSTLTLGPLAAENRRESADAVRRPSPGQFFMLSGFGTGEVPISVSGLDRADGAVEHTIRSVGAATAALVAAPVDSVLGVRGPFGRGWNLDAAMGRDVVVVAGGIGLAPLRPLIEAVLADRGAFGGVRILVGARSPADLCFVDDLEQWARHTDVKVELAVDRLHGPGSEDWVGHVGVVTTLIGHVSFDPAAAAAFVCGPEVMMRFTARSLVGSGLALGDIQVSGERSMTCGIGHCGHCQLGPLLLCRDGPVLGAERFLEFVAVKER